MPAAASTSRRGCAARRPLRVRRAARHRAVRRPGPGRARRRGQSTRSCRARHRTATPASASRWSSRTASARSSPCPASRPSSRAADLAAVRAAGRRDDDRRASPATTWPTRQSGPVLAEWVSTGRRRARLSSPSTPGPWCRHPARSADRGVGPGVLLESEPARGPAVRRADDGHGRGPGRAAATRARARLRALVVVREGAVGCIATGGALGDRSLPLPAPPCTPSTPPVPATRTPVYCWPPIARGGTCLRRSGGPPCGRHLGDAARAGDRPTGMLSARVDR